MIRPKQPYEEWYTEMIKRLEKRKYRGQLDMAYILKGYEAGHCAAVSCRG